MAASGRYDLIVTSNPSMPEIARAVADEVPGIRFIVLDGYLSGHPRIHTVLFNQREQAYLSGYFAGLVTTSTMPGARQERRIGLLAGQEYPIMNEVILTGYREGAQAVDTRITVDFRVLGNWFDAGKAQEIATDMISRGSDVILTIAGGGNQGVVSAAREQRAYALWYDDTGYDEGPGVVAGSSLVRQDQAAYESTRRAIRGELEWGTAAILGVADDAVGFNTDHPEFLSLVPEDLVNEVESLLERLRRGELILEMPLPGH
jgi:riboflavin transport system substrate-binding protein